MIKFQAQIDSCMRERIRNNILALTQAFEIISYLTEIK